MEVLHFHRNVEGNLVGMGMPGPWPWVVAEERPFESPEEVPKNAGGGYAAATA